MARFTVVLSQGRSGRGARGLNLYRFLRVYHGRRNVRLLEADDLLGSRSLSTDYLFVGVPTPLGKQHLHGVRYREAVLFDYEDRPNPAWGESNQGFLRSLSNTYFKPWVESGWDAGIRWGTLPIRRPYRLKSYLRLLKTVAPQVLVSKERPYDVSFVGNGSYAPNSFPQRVRWLRELHNVRDRIRFWGGLTGCHALQAKLREFDSLSDILYPRGQRIGFVKYFNSMLKSHVALAPAGNVPWTYRHYEAIYAGCVVVTTDFRNVKTLIPLPVRQMVHVADDESVVPAVESALAMRAERPDVVAENVRFLEQYLKDSDYSRDKPALMDLFMEQIRCRARTDLERAA